MRKSGCSNTTLFYDWQETFFENGAAAFGRKPRPRRNDLRSQKIEQLEARLKRKDEVIGAFSSSKRDYTGPHFWARSCYVSTVGRDNAAIRDYIMNQEEDAAQSAALSG